MENLKNTNFVISLPVLFYTLLSGNGLEEKEHRFQGRRVDWCFFECVLRETRFMYNILTYTMGLLKFFRVKSADPHVKILVKK